MDDRRTSSAGLGALPAGNAVPPQADPGISPDLLAEDSALYALLRGVSSSSGEECFRVMTQSLAKGLGVKYAVVAEHIPETASVRSLAFWAGDRFLDNVEWLLDGTPCERVIAGEFSHIPSGLQKAFPRDEPLAALRAESYLGVPLLDSNRAVLGHLFVMDTRPMPAGLRNLALFRIFAARAGGELGRVRLERALARSQDEFKDLFDEAPIAYLHESVDSRFLRANRAAVQILGLRPEEVEGTYGKDFFPDTPEAQRRLREALDALARGDVSTGKILELRRKDNGKPIWIRWWSRPDRGRSFTRTMFLDITDTVLMEQEQTRLREQNSYLREEIRAHHNIEEMVGRSPALQQVMNAVRQVAPTDSSVLITGETGTGKELVARALHNASQRREKPFIKVNCAALPAGLVESEFFGHEKGAFTGAAAARKGRFEIADGGTIFLDEVGEVSPEVQVKLLRVLQEREFERVGGSTTIRVNVRVIAATNRDLAADVAAGKFRPDLFYRLSVFPIPVPPLRDRAADIPLLASYFVTQIAAAVGKRIDQIDPDSLDRLTRYSWPGNIRELRNILERAVILTSGSTLKIEPAAVRAGPAATAPAILPAAAPRSLEDVERDHILATLAQANGAIAGPAGAAAMLGLPPSTLRSRMAKLGIKATTKA